MTKEEYKNTMCYDCKFKNCRNDICEKHKDNVKIYKCNDFVSKLKPHKKCKYCNTIVEFKMEDIKTIANKKRYLEYIICTNCNKKIIILESKF